tara:strand:- start:1462 stop:1761 length:300 start_codon:yes stop_codon:yes gene_type:complete
MAGIHEPMKTKTWAAAWDRILRQIYLRERRNEGSWDYALEKLARRSDRDAWGPALTRLAHLANQQADAETEWGRALDKLRRANDQRLKRIEDAEAAEGK